MIDSTAAEPTEAAVDAVEDVSHPLGETEDLRVLADRVADSDYVLLGEASHGTREFYTWRARLTARMIAEHDVDYVAVEGDWEPCYRINRYVKGVSDHDTIRDALDDAFERWPTWMWANWEALEFLEWLAVHNAESTGDDAVGFYGLDVYGLRRSMEAVVDYLEGVDEAAADRARDAYRCFEPHGREGRKYAESLRMVPEDCRDEVVEVLSDIRRNAPDYRDDIDDGYFAAEQSAFAARNAERYYRAMTESSSESWNVRDRHMTDTLERLHEHHGDDATGVVWAHNTHVGDARATNMDERGRLNVGQLVRERVGDDCRIVGFGTHHGSVVAADRWGEPLEEKRVPDARAGSVGDLCHRSLDGDGWLWLRDADDALAELRGHRAIGVVYHPEHEAGNYVPTNLRERYDALIHVEETEALHPLSVHVDRDRVPDLYPWGL